MPEFAITQKTHLPQVDYIRAIASVAVALFHLGGKVLPGLRYGYLGVEMFFLLSGFIICWTIPVDYTLKMAGKFILRRITRIEPPYIISIGLALIAHFLFVTGYKPDWQNVFFHFAYLNSFLNQPYLNPVYWTLAIEFQFYIFIAVFFPLIINKWGPALLLALSVAVIFTNTPVTSLISFFPLFAIGMVYYLYLKGFSSLKTALSFGILIVFCSLFKCGWLQTITGLFALLLLVMPLKDNRIISFFSTISFSLYLTHDIVGSSTVVHLGTLLPKTFFYKGCEFLSGIAISIVFAWLFYLAVESPFLGFSKKIYYKKIS